MNRKGLRRLAQAAAAVCLSLLSVWCWAEDIDIFVGGSGGEGDPNVLIILDNSSNWSAANQAWPTDTAPPVPCGNDCNKQGYYELKAIRSVIQALSDGQGSDATVDSDSKVVPINLGLMLFNNSSAVRDGGYVRYHVRSMTEDNLEDFLETIDTIISQFNTETAASSVQYGAVLFDAFKYFGGYTNPANATVDKAPATNPSYQDIPVFGTRYWGSRLADGEKPDGAAYDGRYYVPPNASTCARNHIIFIGNGFPAKDNTVPNMEQVLKYLLDPSSPPSTIPEFEVSTYTPVLGSCSVVATSPGKDCSTVCTTDAYSDSFFPDKGAEAFIHKCDNPGKACKKGERVYACAITSWNVASSVPTANEANRYGDEFADYLHKTDVSDVLGQQNVTLHAINVFRAKPDANQEALMRSMAYRGGGLYFTATSLEELQAALGEVFSEILSVNSTFASASLPVNATNRAQNENQVYIGMFRPDVDAKPRWFGNLKRYQLAFFEDEVRLADVTGRRAVNTQTGFVTDCATSWWTTDSVSANQSTADPLPGWWFDYPVKPSAASACTTSGHDPFSDAPDGPQVEKGAVAEVIRKGNNPTTTDTSPTWAVNRTIYTLSGGALAELTTGASGLDAGLVDFVLGHDVMDEDKDEDTDEVRASLHGPVIHSRALPVTYKSGIKIFYGANDGTLRMVDTETGKEDWAFVAPEFFPKLNRLMANSPRVRYPGQTLEGAEPMSYFFDGSIGLYQELDDANVWIFPTMRRGGNSVYAFDVKTPGSPAFMWKVDPTTSGFADLGQTWSYPNVTRLKGFQDDEGKPRPVIVMGGGYDGCEDANDKAPVCVSPKGAGVYVLDAESGALLRSFATTRSVAADVSLVDVDYDGFVDYAYAADAGGNIWRLKFEPMLADEADGAWADKWAFHRVAYTNGAGRKFLFGPAILPTKDGIYLAIGSGDREHPLIDDYPYVDVLNRFYVVIDDPGKTDAVDLDQMTDFTIPTDCYDPGVLPGSGKKGWFIDLNAYGKGEQTVTSALIAGGMVTFSTNRPVEAAPCKNLLGEARGYWLNLLNASGAIGVADNCGGERSGTFAGGGLPPSPVLATVPITSSTGGDENATRLVTAVIGAVQKGDAAGSVVSSGIDGQEVRPTISFRRSRVFWYQEDDE